MTRDVFFPRGPGLRLADLASLCRAELLNGDPDARVTGLAALDEAGPDDLGFFDNPRHRQALRDTRAGCVLIAKSQLAGARADQPLLVVRRPADSFAEAGRALFPAAFRPEPLNHRRGVAPSAVIDPTAVLEEGVVVEDFALVSAGAMVGQGTVLGPGAVIGPGCRIGRDCRIGARAVVQHAFLGNGVVLHPGVAIGQDGFGYSVGRTGIAKVVQVGRVILQDNVEIGANTTIDRGSVRDTVIGENTKIDNQVQIGHNARVGRNCIIVSQVALAGSVTLGDGVMIGGQTCINNHLTVGDGAQIAGASVVVEDVAAGAKLGGTPARPIRHWLREMTRKRNAAFGVSERGEAE